MYKMIIVDDEPLMLEGISRAMDWESHGYQLIGAFRSPDGLQEFCEKERPDVLLLDITMPEVSGISLLKEIKDRFPEICIIMLTAHNEFSYVRDSLRYRADEYLWKPEINFQDILNCMNKVLERRDREEDNQSREKKIYEFSDYQRDMDNFSAESFNQTVADMEYALNMGNWRTLSATWERVGEMILRDGPSKENLLSGVLHIFHLYREYLQKLSLAEESVDEKEILSVFYKNVSYQEFKEELFCLFEKMNEVLYHSNDFDTDELKRKIMHYMEENLSNSNLNLMELSRAVGLSYSYCSRVFPEIMGKNFSRYLVDIRMERACEYLKYSDYRITRIMELVGYMDKSYFVKSFRQYTSYTPFQYREKYRVKGNEGQREEKKNS